MKAEANAECVYTHTSIPSLVFGESQLYMGASYPGSYSSNVKNFIQNCYKKQNLRLKNVDFFVDVC